MDDLFDRELRAGLQAMLSASAGEHPRWVTSPAAARVAGHPTDLVRGDRLPRPNVWLRRRSALAVLIAALGLALASMLVVASGAFHEEVPVTPTQLIPTSAPLRGSGIELVSPRGPDYGHAVLDVDGRSIWLLGSGELTRVDTASGTVTTWTIADDLAFAAGFVSAARDGGVWLSSLFEEARWLRRFDGRSFPTMIEVPLDITAVAEGPDGTIWAASDSSLERWREGRWEPIALPEAAPSWPVALSVDDSNRLWVGRPGRVDVLDDAVWQTFDGSDAAIRGEVWSIAPRPDGSVWVASSGGLARFQDDRWATVLPAPGGPARATSSEIGPGATIWVASANPGNGQVTVARFTDGAWQHYGPAEGLPATGYVTAWVIRAADAVHVATGSGLYRFEAGQWRVVWPGVAPAAPSPWSGAFVPVSRTEAWAADEVGLWHHIDSAWTLERTWDRPVDRPRWDMGLALAADGSVWAATPDGALRLDPAAGWSVLDPNPALRVAPAPDGSVWIVAEDLTRRFDPRGLLIATAASPETVGQIVAAADGSLFNNWWDLMEAGLDRYDGSRWSSVQPLPGEDQRVLDVVATPNGDVWVALSGAQGLARWDDGQWQLYGVAMPEVVNPGLNPALEVGPDGQLWLAGRTSLLRRDGDAWDPVKPGLWVDLYWIAPDGWVWADALPGLIRFDPEAD